jgi:hypothetical protein
MGAVTRYVMTKVELGLIPAGTIGRAEPLDFAHHTIDLHFNDGAVYRIVGEIYDRVVFELRPTAWKADLYDGTRWRRVVLPADPVTFDPPEQWRVPVLRELHEPFTTTDAALTSTMDILTFDRVRIPESSDVWFYRAGATRRDGF